MDMQEMAGLQHYSEQQLSETSSVLRSITVDASTEDHHTPPPPIEDGSMSWQTGRHKAKILAHPLYQQLLSVHVACLRIDPPVDQLPRIDAQLAQSQQVVAKYSGLLQGHGGISMGDDKELDQFMTHYVALLCSFKDQLQQHVHVRENAMEAVMACWELEQSRQSLTGVSPGEGTGAAMSDDDEDQLESDNNMFDGSLDGHDSTGFGPLVPTKSERSLMERVRQELKHELKQAKILAHPLYQQLLSVHVACLRIDPPVDQLPRIDAQLAQSQQVVAKYSGLLQGHGGISMGDDKELDQFMTHYVALLCSFKDQLQQHVHVRENAMEAVMACWELEQSRQSLTGVSPGEGTGAAMSDDDEDQLESDNNMFDGSLDGHDSTGFGPLVPTKSERSLMERVRQELKHELKQAKILAHPLYQQLLSVHVACLRIDPPVDQLPRIDAQLAQSQQVVAKYSGLLQGHGGISMGDDKELDQFMTHYVALLCSFKDQLQQHVHVRENAMEAVMACWELEQSRQSLTGVSPGEGTGAAMSDDDEDQLESDNNMFDGSLDGHDSTGFGPLVPTKSERSLMERVRQELKHELKQVSF